MRILGRQPGDDRLDLAGHLALEEEREERDDAAHRDPQEPPERPPQHAPQHEVAGEVEHVEPAVNGEQEDREVEPGEGVDRAQRDEPGGTVQFDVAAEAVAGHHHDHEPEQEDARDDRGDLVDRESSSDEGDVCGLRADHHALSLRARAGANRARGQPRPGQLRPHPARPAPSPARPSRGATTGTRRNRRR